MRAPVEAQVVTAALERARGRRQPDASLLHQSARGAQSASHASRGLRADQGLGCRRRGKGDGLDQAVAARCLGRVQRARTANRYSRTRQEARADRREDSERCYNSWRQQSSLGDVRPNAYEKIARVA